MKNENFNVNIKTLDDQALYAEICRKIEEIERRRFRALWLVPFISGVLILLLWQNVVPDLIMLLVSSFGALITLFIMHWEKYHIQMTHAFKKHAAILESRKTRQEKLDVADAFDGPYSMISQLQDPAIFSLPDHQNSYTTGSVNTDKNPAVSGKGWSRDQAEVAVYYSTIILWVVTLLLGLVKLLIPSQQLIL